MSQQRYPAAVPDPAGEEEPAAAFITDCHRKAVERLELSFEEKRPLAIMIGEGTSASSVAVRSFVSGLDEEVAVALIGAPCADATEFMRKIISAVGFQPKDMCLEDLESIFAMFLSFQKSHDRRTVICVERAQDSEPWVLDKLRTLVEFERDGHCGLMIIVSGQSGLKELLHRGPLSGISALAGKRIMLVPFTLAETKEFISRRLEAVGSGSIDQLFQYQSIVHIHELSRGVPDAVGSLVNQSLMLAEREGVALVTAELVQRADDMGQAANGVLDGDDHAATINLNGSRPPVGCLVYQLSGEDVRELTLSKGHTLIGRSKLCDIRIKSAIVSRQHALISFTPEAATIVDLSSTNGTYVDGYPIKRHELAPGETIVVGGCQIEYVLDGNQQDRIPTDEPAITSIPSSFA